MKHQYAIFIGRFNPFHFGHLNILKRGFSLADNIVIVLGSHNRAVDIKNPWNSQERIAMIKSSLTSEEVDRISFVLLKDSLYNNSLWKIDLQNKIAEVTNDSKDVILIGYESDNSSFYLKSFPKWEFYSCPTTYKFHASDIRNKIFTKEKNLKEYVHINVNNLIINWMETDVFLNLKDEFEFIKEYKQKWNNAPFSPIFVTVDNVVLKSGHLLLVRRKQKHGKGLLALPGGFLNQDEEIIDGAIRELKEETRLNISKENLYKSIIDRHVFDHPQRSLRGRTITHVFMLNLGDGELPKVKGNNDTDKAFWIPLNETMQREQDFFEDHFYIIQYFINKF